PDIIAGVADSGLSYDAFIATLPTPGAAAPEVSVTGNSVEIASGDATPSTADQTNFGTASVGTPVDRIFTVHNAGSAILATASLSVPTGFSIVEGLSASIAAGASDTFTVHFGAAAEGTSSGNVTFTTNDSDESSYS